PRPPPPQAGAFGRGERWRREKTASPAAHPAQRSVAALLGPCASARRPPGATPRRRGGCSFVRTSAQRGQTPPRLGAPRRGGRRATERSGRLPDGRGGE
ncbi:unnamed protein product, partial [Prorocentrum cordatum]